jgi:hypothetical protein
VGRAVAGTAAKLSVKAATLGIIGAAEVQQLEALKSDIADAVAETSEAAVKRLLEDHAEREADFAALKASLTALPGLLRPTAPEDADEQANAPLVVIIDELDRCRPDFALGVLETLKHFFRADNLHFVLVTNRDHLALSVAHRYGSGSASGEYLQKFYDFVVYFENSYDRRQGLHVGTFVRALADKLLVPGTRDTHDVVQYVEAAALAQRMSLRQIEAVFTNIALAQITFSKSEFRPTVLVTFLSLIKALRADLYRKAKSGTLKPDEVASFLRESADWGDFDVERVVQIFTYYLQPDLDVNEQQWRGYGNALFQYNLERERVIPYLANSILDRFGRGG